MKKVKAAPLFRPCGLVPPGIAEHSVRILHFKINHSRLSTKRKTRAFTHRCKLTRTSKCTFTQLVTGIVFGPCPALTGQPQHVTAVCDSGLLLFHGRVRTSDHQHSPKAETLQDWITCYMTQWDAEIFYPNQGCVYPRRYFCSWVHGNMDCGVAQLIWKKKIEITIKN